MYKSYINTCKYIILKIFYKKIKMTNVYISIILLNIILDREKYKLRAIFNIVPIM